ncbi:MAG: hypothetical protein L0Z54_03105, partial [Thermoplasmata archaeon]|nr:hypothetical protein [Thermoplasmata archaeon]
LMVAAGLLGIVFWFSHFFLGYYYGTLEVDVEDEGSRSMFGFSVIMLMSSAFLLLGSNYIQRRDFRMSFFSALFGIFSFGWFVGSVMSAICLMIVVHNTEEFKRPASKGSASRPEPSMDRYGDTMPRRR